jgi:hypothetical protein
MIRCALENCRKPRRRASMVAALVPARDRRGHVRALVCPEHLEQPTYGDPLNDPTGAPERDLY